MKNIKLRKLLGGISASVLAGGSVLAVTACNKTKKEEALNTQVTKFIETDGTILYVGNANGIEKVIAKITKLIPKLKNSVTLELDGADAIKITKDGADSENLKTGALEKAKYNFEIKTKDSKKAESKNVIKGSFNVSLAKKAEINNDFLNKFNMEYVNTNLTNKFAKDADMKASVSEAITAAISFQWEDSTDISVNISGDPKADASKKDKHEVVFNLKGSSEDIKSKDFKTNFKYNLEETEGSKADISTIEAIKIEENIEVTVVDQTDFKATLDELQTAIVPKVLAVLKTSVKNDNLSDSDFELAIKKNDDAEIDAAGVAIATATKFKVTITAKGDIIQGAKTIEVNCIKK